LTAEEVAEAAFTTVRRGFDETEVRDFLSYLARDYDAALDQAAGASKQLVELQQHYQQTVGAWRAATSALQAAETAAEEARARQRQAEGRTTALQRERDDAARKANDLQAMLDLARSELDDTRAAMVKAEQAQATDDKDSYSHLGEEVAALLRSASEAAESVRSEAERYAAHTRGEADEYLARLRRDADEMVAEANQEATNLRSAADAYANETRHAADVAAQRVESEAAEEARLRVDTARSEATTLVAAAEESVSELRATEAQLREGLVTLSQMIKHHLDEPTDVPDAE
jgi:DivIVA domain-containing protein